jgi:phosphoribosyl 1,2-cyclic phosphate phosphodiesterase
MKIEFLGTGGPVPIPRFGCDCFKCEEARKNGIPFSRGGPSVFVHGPDILIDTPEDIHFLLERSTVKHIAGGMYSHWHPDHVMGRRIWEIVNMDWDNYPAKNQCTPLYLPRRVSEDFTHTLGSGNHLEYLEHMGVIKIHTIEAWDSVTVDSVKITIIPLNLDYSFGFLFDYGTKRALIVMDEISGWEPPDDLSGLDVAVIPTGLFEINPYTGERYITNGHPILKAETMFSECLSIMKKLDPGRGYMTHNEGFLTIGDQTRLRDEIRAGGLNLDFAYDTQIVEI